MNESEIPPILASQPPPLVSEPARPRWRWGVHLSLLILYVLAMGFAGVFFRSAGDGSGSVEAAMPKTFKGLVIMCSMDVGFFLLIFALACAFSRPRLDELFFKWRGGIKPLLWGIAYSIGLRVAVAIVTILVALPYVMVKGEKELEKMRPKIEAVVDTEALKDPAYLIFTLTFLSFGLAGFREELWRAGVLAGFAGVAPKVFASRKGQCIGVMIAAIIFGLGHLPQGWGGVGLTTALGIGLGLIIVWHRSIWEAILAHGFFDATSFAMLFLVAKFAPEALRAVGISPK